MILHYPGFSPFQEMDMEIAIIGNEVLRAKSATIDTFDEELAAFAEEMIGTMIRGNGIGLAAPQVGVSQRLFVCKIPDREALVFINPEIIATSQEIVPYEEGCLSIPGMYAEVTRPEAISIQAFNLKGKPFKMDATGLLARVIQHELDHLNGVLFVDHLSVPKRERLLRIFEKKMRA